MPPRPRRRDHVGTLRHQLPRRCSLKFHVKDDEVSPWVDTYTTQDGDFEDVLPRACLRGRTYCRWFARPQPRQLPH